jgi:hypothetical protein
VNAAPDRTCAVCGRRVVSTLNGVWVHLSWVGANDWHAAVPSKTYVTKSGTVLTEADLKKLADEAEAGYCTATVEAADHRARCFKPLPCSIHSEGRREPKE